MEREEKVALMYRRDLVRIKARALRTDAWFRALSRTERNIINLTIKCVEKVRSPILARTISGIIGKILQTLENRFLTRTQRIGRELAKKIARIAEKWGNKDAPNWEHDKDFISFLGVSAVTSSETAKSRWRGN